ncbi:MAG: hypothetical protein ITG01_01460 [Comamonas sp.]|nr:hypothetical protein [Comamonas sp.]
MNQSFTAQRRQFIAALSSCMLLAAAPIATAQSLTPKASSNKMRELMALGNALAGTQVSDAALVEQYLQVLQEHLPPAQLEALLALSHLPAPQQKTASLTPPVQASAEFALQLWMSGMSPGPAPVVMAYVDAPVWAALSSFTKPPGVCGGAFGYWADRPV